MRNKKTIIFILSILLIISLIVLVVLFIDSEEPQIILSKDKLNVSCNVTIDDLINKASAIDNRKVKDFFIEEDSLIDIAEKGKLTYVAVDEQNNVNKKITFVDVDEKVITKSIQNIKPLIIPLDEEFEVNDYFKVVNGCGWEYNLDLEVSGLDTSKVGMYEVEIKSSKDDGVPVLQTKIEVKDFEVPTIHLVDETIYLKKGDYYNFKNIISRLEDNKDSEEELYKNLELSYINTNIVGKQELIIEVTDSDGKKAKTSVTVIIEDIPQIEVEIQPEVKPDENIEQVEPETQGNTEI